MISLRSVTKRFAGATSDAAHDLSLDVSEGEVVVLVGPSGCGKTTTMRMINRLIEPTAGTIVVEGTDVMKRDPVELRRGIGYVIQTIGLFPHRTIAHNIATVPACWAGKATRASGRRAGRRSSGSYLDLPPLPASSRAGSSSGSVSRGRSPPTRPSC